LKTWNMCGVLISVSSFFWVFLTCVCVCLCVWRACILFLALFAYCFLLVMGVSLFWMHFVALVGCVVVGWVRMGFLGVRSEEDGMESAAFLMFLEVRSF